MSFTSTKEWILVLAWMHPCSLLCSFVIYPIVELPCGSDRASPSYTRETVWASYAACSSVFSTSTEKREHVFEHYTPHLTVFHRHSDGAGAGVGASSGTVPHDALFLFCCCFYFDLQSVQPKLFTSELALEGKKSKWTAVWQMGQQISVYYINIDWDI